MSSSLWVQHVPAGQFASITPPSKLVVTNASLGCDLLTARGRGELRFAHAGLDEAVTIAGFSRDVCEHVRLEVVLEAHVHYAFAAVGPYSVDLLGYFARDAGSLAHLQPAGSPSKQSFQTSRTSTQPTKRSRGDDDAALPLEKRHKPRTSGPHHTSGQGGTSNSGRSKGTANPPSTGTASNAGVFGKAGVFGILGRNPSAV